LHELYPETEAYAEELAEAISRLARLTQRQGDSVLADRLCEVVEGIA
jgi:hypothetical protein